MASPNALHRRVSHQLASPNALHRKLGKNIAGTWQRFQTGGRPVPEEEVRASPGAGGWGVRSVAWPPGP